jgi:hypothetical protein
MTLIKRTFIYINLVLLFLLLHGLWDSSYLELFSSNEYRDQVRKAELIGFSNEDHDPLVKYGNIEIPIEEGDYALIYACIPLRGKNDRHDIKYSIGDTHPLSLNETLYRLNNDDLKKYQRVNLFKNIEFLSGADRTKSISGYLDYYVQGSTIFHVNKGTDVIHILYEDSELTCRASILLLIKEAKNADSSWVALSLYQKVVVICFILSIAYFVVLFLVFILFSFVETIIGLVRK